MLDLLVNALKEYFPLFFERLLTSVEQPRDDLGVFELHLSFLIVRALHLYHIDLIDLLFDLLDLFVQTLFVWSYHGRLIVSLELGRLLEQVNDKADKKNSQDKVNIIDEEAGDT